MDISHFQHAYKEVLNLYDNAGMTHTCNIPFCAVYIILFLNF